MKCSFKIVFPPGEKKRCSSVKPLGCD